MSMLYRSEKCRESQKEKQQTVSNKYEELLKEKCREKIKIVDVIVGDSANVFCILTDLRWIWDGHLTRINSKKHWIEFFFADSKAMHSAPFRSAPNAFKFEKSGLIKCYKREW